MMDYNVFKTVFVKRIGDYMPAEFRDHEATVRSVRKVNRTRDALTMRPPDPVASEPMPTLYLEDIYEDFCCDEDLNRVLSKSAYILAAYSGMDLPMEDRENFSAMKDKVVMNLINREMNEELLEDLPHRDFMDLAIIYRIVFRTDENGILSLMVNDEIRKRMGVTEEELQDLARENTRRIFPAQIMEQNEYMYIMTNDAIVNGATTMLYKEDMKALAEKIGGDFLILPSSVHEFFAIPANKGDVGKMAAMLAGGNGTVTDWSEVLSRSIYLYSAEQEELRMCATCMQSTPHSVATEAELI